MSKDNGRRPGHEPVLTPEYEDKIPVANKVTIAPKTEWEKTLLLRRPTGRANRVKVAKVMPHVARFQEFADEDETLLSEAERRRRNARFMTVMAEIWAEPGFEEEIVPFVLGLDDEPGQRYLENLEFTDLMGPVMKAIMYVSSRENTEALQEALKKSEGEVEEVLESA